VIEPKPNIKDLFRYPILQEGRYDKLRLDKNENTIGFSREVISEMLSGISPDFLAAYPEPYTLYQKIAKQHGIVVDALVVTSGSEMAIRYLFEAFLAQDDEIVILNPSFAMFEVYARIIGAKIQTVDYDQKFQISPESVIERIGRATRIVAIANPNNPTGSVFSQQDLEKILKAAAKNQTIVLVDEAYYYFCRETMAPRCLEFSNLVVTRTFSKACGMAGMRLGYAVGVPELISQIKKLQPIDHVSNFAVKIGEYILDHEELVWEYAAEVEKGKAFLQAELSQMGFRVTGSHANFVLVDFGERRTELVQKLRDRDILVASNLRFPFASGYVRVTAGPVAQMQRFVRELKSMSGANASPTGRSH
jgi:histidinol-phosphate aminotransferase